MIIIRPSALKHGYTKEEIEQVLASGERFDVEPDNEDNPQQAVIGHTQKGVVLEVRVTYLSNPDLDSVYHCMKANAHWTGLYSERLRSIL
jgi:hypothetical protein